MLELHDLSRSYGQIVALDGLSLEVPDGDVVGFVGPIGAGKTTAMRIALGVLEPDAGDDGPQDFTVGAQGTKAVAIAEAARASGTAFDARIEVRRFAGAAQARAAARRGDVDAAIVGDATTRARS